MDFGVGTFIGADGAPVQMIAALAESLGFESFFVSEHSHIPVSTDFPMAPEVPLIYKSMLDPFVGLGACAAATETIRLGTAICILPQRDAIHTAKEVATLDQISKGRFVFGIGAGWNAPEMENHGIPFAERFARTREALEAMQAFWENDEAEYSGKLISYERSWMYPKPVQKPGPELVLAGGGPNILKRCVSLGCGWMPVFVPALPAGMEGRVTPLDSLGRARETLQELEQAEGRPRTRISAMGLPPTPEFIDTLLEHGVERMILSISSESEVSVKQQLEQIREAVAAYC